MKPIISQTLRAVLQATMGGFLLSGCADRVDAPTGPGAFAPSQSTLANEFDIRHFSRYLVSMG